MRLPALRATAGIAAALSVLAMACACVSAQAASYTVWSCRGPDGAPIGTQAWRAGDERGATQDTCAQQGSLRARLLPSDNEPGLTRGFRFALPPGATVSGYRIHLYAATSKALNDDAFAAGLDDDAALSFGEVDAGCANAGCVFGTFEDPLDEDNLAQENDIESAGLVLGAHCGALLGCYGQLGEPTLAEARLFRAQVDVRDDEPPVLGAPSGELVAGAALTGAAASVSFDAQDDGGGVAALALLIDGAEVARKDAGGSCADPYVEPVPCPAALSATLHADLTALSQGLHEARLHALDAAGNVTTGTAIAFTVGTASQPPGPPSPPPGPSSPSPPPGQQTLVERVVTAPVAPQPVTIDADDQRVDLSRSGAFVRGIVKDAAGKPLAGAKVIVRSRPFGVRRARTRTERTLTTDGAGRFSMPAGVVSRLLVVDVDDGAHRARDEVEVELLNRLRIAAFVPRGTLQNGSVMRLRADISGAGAGTRDKVVLIQAVVGGRWATVDSLRADDDGRAVWRYRFRGTTRRAIYRFRVQVERAGDVWPWPTTTSEVLRVAVRP